MLVTLLGENQHSWGGVGSVICFKTVDACSTHGTNNWNGSEWTDKRNGKKKLLVHSVDLWNLQGTVGPNCLYVLEQHLTECIAAFCHLSFHSHGNKHRIFTRDIFKKNVINHWSTAPAWLIRIKVLHSWQLVTNISWSWRDKKKETSFIVYFTH